MYLSYESGDREFLSYCDVHMSETDYGGKKKCTAGTWFYSPAADWMEAGLNASTCALKHPKHELR